MKSVDELKKGDILTNTNHGFSIEIVEIGKKILVISIWKLERRQKALPVNLISCFGQACLLMKTTAH